MDQYVYGRYPFMSVHVFKNKLSGHTTIYIDTNKLNLKDVRGMKTIMEWSDTAEIRGFRTLSINIKRDLLNGHHY